MEISRPKIRITGGVLVGNYSQNGVAVFKGIPYAKPPVGELRFKPPVPMDPWDGELDCSEYGNSPIQNDINHNPLWTDEFLIRNENFSEDCLTLNVFAKTGCDKKLPVIVYLYGGGFVSGGSSCDIYDGTRIAEKGVVFITFNHREGTLALYSSEKMSKTSELGVSGNLILLDDIAVLKWVKDNIEFFGGDPENVTIMGQSSGASQVNALSISNVASGLFTKTISLGFNNYTEFYRPFSTKEEGYQTCRDIVSSSGLSEEEFLALPAAEYLKYKAVNQLTLDGKILDLKFKDAVREGRTGKYLTVMEAVPGDSLMGGLFGSFAAQGVPIKEMSQVEEVLKDFFEEGYEKAREIYITAERTVDEVKKKINEDFLIAAMLYFAGDRLRTNPEQPAYIFFFAHPMPGPMKEKFGAFHSCEVPYFTNVFSDLRKDFWQEEDYALGEYMLDLLVGFVRDAVMPEGFLPSDGTNYFWIDAGEKRNCEFEKDKKELWLSAFMRKNQ